MNLHTLRFIKVERFAWEYKTSRLQDIIKIKGRHLSCIFEFILCKMCLIEKKIVRLKYL